MKKALPYILIAVVILLAAGFFIDRFGSDINLMANSTGSTNTDKETMPNINFENYGAAPEFSGIVNWLNSEPLTIAELKGKVVLVDFWTYSCINCIRTLPYVTKWYDTYKDQGFVVIGVHTPEFEFEKVTANVKTAAERFGIHYPIAQDNQYRTWQAYNNRYWPAEYLIDKSGNIVYTHFGEGEYSRTENAIRILLGLDKPAAKTQVEDLSKIRSPEMYFELPRLEYLSSKQTPNRQGFNYKLPEDLKLNTFALEGNWCFDDEKASLCGPGGGKIRLKFSSGKVFMVAASPQKHITLKISVDGKPQKDVEINMSQLYTLFESSEYKEHTIDIEIPEAGFQAFTFTFG